MGYTRQYIQQYIEFDFLPCKTEWEGRKASEIGPKNRLGHIFFQSLFSTHLSPLLTHSYTSHHSPLTLTPLSTPPSLSHLSALLPFSHTSHHSSLTLTPLTTPPSLSHLSPLLPHSYTFPTHSMRIGKKYWLSLPSHTPPTNSWYSSMTILEKFFSRFLIYRVSRNKNFINKKTQDASGVVNASKLWKYIGHTIVPYYTTIQDQHTFNAYHPIFSLTHRLSVYCMVLLYDSIVQCFVWQYFMVQLH